MTTLSPSLDAALSGVAPTIFGSVAIDLPGYNLSLLDGAGTLSFGGRTYAGEDATYGVLDSVAALSDGMGDEAPRLSITLLPASDAAAADLAGASMQGSRVAIHMGAIVPATGQVVPDPDLLFLGELDVPALRSGEHRRELEIEVASVFERFFEDDWAAALADGYHRSIWPGEAGFGFVTSAAQGVYWGVERPAGAVIPTNSSSQRGG